MRAVTAALVACALTLAGSNALAQERAGNGVELDIGVVDRTFPLAGEINLTVPARVGYRFDRLAIMLGVYGIRGSIGAEGKDFDGEETSVTMSALALNLAPTVRFYLTDLEAGKLVPYVQGEFNYVISATSTDREPERPVVESEDLFDRTLLGFAASVGANTWSRRISASPATSPFARSTSASFGRTPRRAPRTC